MLTFILVIAAFVLVMTALTYSELQQPVSFKPKWSEAPIGLRAFVWVTVTAVILLLVAGVVT